MTSVALRLQGVSKEAAARKGPVRPILQDLTLEVNTGEVFGLLGLEGAGKTTLLKILAGLNRPTRGRVDILGIAAPSPRQLRGRLGYISESRGLYESMEVREIAGLCRGLSERWDGEGLAGLLQAASVSSRARVGSLSRSQRSFLYLGLTLAPGPEVLLLDEPADALDDRGKELLIQKLLEYMEAPGRTILAASRGVLDLAGILDRAAVLQEGKVVYCGGLSSMQASFCKVRIVPRGPADFSGIPGVYGVEREHRSYLVKIRHEREEALKALRGMPNDFLDVIPLSIQDTYLELVKGGKGHV
jgi:ABC-2 type transport system ATP-binding protein